MRLDNKNTRNCAIYVLENTKLCQCQYSILINYNTHIFTRPVRNIAHTLLPHCKCICKANIYQMIISILSLTFYVYVLLLFSPEIPTSGKVPNSSGQTSKHPFLMISPCFGFLVVPLLHRW